jgi:predicted metalloprotease with PDZ domain
MRHSIRWALLGTGILLAASLAFAQTPQGTLAFTVSMERPENHIYHVVLRCEGLAGDTREFRMPVWSPGYYGIRNFDRNVRDFHAADGRGRELKWEKSANSWMVQTGNAPVVTVTYDVLTTSNFVADPYLGEDRGYIVGTGVFMYVAGHIQHPVTVAIQLPPTWKSIATGLDPVSPDAPHILTAPDFDVLYDSPILMGNLEFLTPFEIQGVPHYFIGLRLGGDNFNREQFIKNLKAVVEQGIAVIGEIPYKHYTFIGIGAGQGGIEHLNSTTVPFTGNPNLDTRAGMIRQMNFLGHEYFHNYNVKRIRPIALGPFDYDRPNLTHMLWVSEGFTSYYEYLMVTRAGIMNQVELLDYLRRDIAAYENNTGHLYQSATQSSWETWSQGPFGGRGRGGVSKSISYYNKGAALGMLLDFKIRHEKRNKSSLDTVMQTLYRKYYKELKRGWTDEEFRDVCESIAGVSLQEVFDYASTTGNIDYDKYLGYAGLELEKPVELPDPDLGAIIEEVNGKPVITAMEGGSPARQSGLAVNDEIVTLDGVEVDAAALNKAIASKAPGDRVVFGISRAGKNIEVAITLGHKLQRSFKIISIADPDALQAAILEDWMKAK